MANKIFNISQDERFAVRSAASQAVRYWPNAHLGDYTASQDIRSAFTRIRRSIQRGDSILCAAAAVEHDAILHANM